MLHSPATFYSGAKIQTEQTLRFIVIAFKNQPIVIICINNYLVIMEKHNPIIIIDDDDEDLELICEAFKEVAVDNELVCFKHANDALSFLKDPVQQPLFILCDVNMNSVSGLDLRQLLHKDENLRVKSIPFLFLSANGNRKDIENAYSLSVQGYFRKPGTFDEYISLMRRITEYWTYCQHPNTEGLRDDELY